MKFSKYNFVVEKDEDLVLYNSLNQGFVKINKEPDLSSFKNLLKTQELSLENPMVRALFERGYIVEDDFNEYQFAKETIKQDYENNAKDFTLMLYLTEQCNFRCVYCPEEHVNKKISKDTLDYLYKHIEKNVNKGNYKKISICLFGGEPLLEFKKIKYFLEKLSKLKEIFVDLEISNSIITNGYLLTPKIYHELVKNHVLHYQITLDGFADTHDKNRPRIDGKGTWEKIIENLKYINSVNDTTSIQVRINYNNDNQATITSFIEWFEQEFDNQKFSLDPNAVQAFSDKVDETFLGDSKSDDAKKIREHVLSNSEKNLLYMGLARLALTCNCSQKSYYSLTVTGQFSKCEQSYSNYAACGYIDTNGDFIYTNEIGKFNENPEILECENCKVYPLCTARACVIRSPEVYCNENFRKENYDNICELLKKGNL